MKRAGFMTNCDARTNERAKWGRANCRVFFGEKGDVYSETRTQNWNLRRRRRLITSI